MHDVWVEPILLNNLRLEHKERKLTPNLKNSLQNWFNDNYSIFSWTTSHSTCCKFSISSSDLHHAFQSPTLTRFRIVRNLSTMTILSSTRVPSISPKTIVVNTCTASFVLGDLAPLISSFSDEGTLPKTFKVFLLNSDMDRFGDFAATVGRQFRGNQ